MSGLFTRVADLLSLGADPAMAWSDPGQRLDQHFESLLRPARRSPSSGAALAHGVAELAAESAMMLRTLPQQRLSAL